MASTSNIFKSRFPDVAIEDHLLHDIVFKDIAKFGESPALVDGPSGRTINYNQLVPMIERFGAAITSRGFAQGDVMCIFAPNIPEFVIAFHAIISVGGVVTTANPLYTAAELAKQLKDSEAKFLISVGPFMDKCKEAMKIDGVTCEELFVFGAEDLDGVTSYATLLQNDGSAFPRGLKIQPTDTAILPYSSGTSGLPKGVELTHRCLSANLQQILIPGCLELSPEDTLLGLLPFFHAYGMIVIMNAGLAKGAKIVTLPKFDPAVFLTTLQAQKVNIAHLVPPLVLFLAKHPIIDKFDLSSIREIVSGAAPLGVEVATACKERLGVKFIRQGYGMTELSPVATLTRMGVENYGAGGELIPNTEARIVDVDNGADRGVDEEGELWIRGPQVMKGYLNNPEATAATIDADGWLHTGDVGKFDADGYLYIVDRVKELIKYKGYQVAPAELEAKLLAHEKIADAAVIPVADEEAGEIPKAYVVRRDESLTEKDVMDFISAQVAPHKKVRVVEFIDAIPKSASGKILRRVLKQREQDKKAEPAAAAAE